MNDMRVALTMECLIVRVIQSYYLVLNKGFALNGLAKIEISLFAMPVIVPIIA